MAIKLNFKTKSLDYINKEQVTTPKVANYLLPTRIIAPIGSIQPVLLELETSLLEDKRFFTIPVTCLSKQEIIYEELLKNQFFIEFRYINDLRNFLIAAMKILQREQKIDWIYTGLGYHHHQGKRYFLLGDTQLPDGTTARYHDQTVIFKRGTSKDFRDFLNQEILGTTPTQLALAIGLASPIATRLKDLVDIQTIIFNIHGPSSTGKTTIAQFMASLWGEPRVTGRGIVRTFNSTVNGITAGNEGINGVPIVLDDLSGSSIQDKTQFVYTLSEGAPKTRATTTGKVQPTGHPWSGVVIITSETPLLNDTEAKQGLLVRVIDSQRMVWTQSSDHAENMKRFITNCHGHLGFEFVQGLDTLTEQNLIDQFQLAKKEVLLALSEHDNLTIRISNKLAIIHMTSLLIEKILGIKLDRQKILSELVLFDQVNINERSIGYRAYEEIKLHIINNFNLYEVFHENGDLIHVNPRKDFHARLDYEHTTLIGTFPHQNFKRILKQAQINEYEHVLDYLAENQLCAIKDKGRRAIKFKDFKTRVIRVYFKQNLFSGLIPWHGFVWPDGEVAFEDNSKGNYDL